MKKGVRVVVLVVLLAAAAGVIYSRRTLPTAPGQSAIAPLAASGVMQARQISVASEFGGVVAGITVQEGDAVEEGQLIARLDTAMLDAQIVVAEAVVDVADAGLREAMAGARPGQVAVAEAQLDQVEAAQIAAQRAVSDTLALVESPQNIDLQIAVMRGQWEAARQREAAAVAQKDAVEVAKSAFDDAYARFDGGGRQKFGVAQGSVEELIIDTLPPELSGQLPPGWSDSLPHVQDRTFTYGDWELHLDNGAYDLFVYKNISFPLEAQSLPNLWWQAWVGVNAASARTEGLEAKLGQLYIQRSEPQVMQMQLDEAVALSAQLAAKATLAQTQVDALGAGMTDEGLAAISARVDQAKAGLEALRRQREMLILTSPISGRVVEILVYPGEVAAQGAALMSVADLADITLTVYIPETRLGEVWLHQPVEVMVDSFPERAFTGYVSFISDRAEFTPRNVATTEERQNLVFAVDLRLNNEDGSLKPGMPADVRFSSSGLD